MSKQPSPSLYNLIKSLDASEKRYYKLHVQNNGKGELNLKLFDAINESVQDEFDFDENKLYESLKDDFKTRGHYNTHKERLFESILSVMQIKWINNESDADNSLHNEIQKINFLISKSQLEQADSRIKKAMDMAEKHERFIHMCHLIRLEQRISIGRGDVWAEKDADDLSDKLKEIMTRLTSYMRAMDIELRHRQVLNQVSISKSRSPFKLKVFKDLAEELLREDSALLHSTEARLVKFNLDINVLKEEAILSNYSTLNFKAIADKYEGHIVQLVSKDEKVNPAQSFPEAFMRFLYLYSAACISHETDRGESTLEKLIAFNSTNEYVNRHKDGYALMCSLWIANEKLCGKKFGEALALYKQFKKTEIGVQAQLRLSIYHYMAIGHIVHNDYSQAKSIFRKIIKLGEKNPILRPDIRIVAIVGLVLIAHKEKKGANIINPLIKEARLYLKSKSIEPVAYEMIFNFIKKDSKVSATRREIFQLVNQLKMYDRSNSAPFEYFDYINWFEAMYEGIEFIDFLRRLLAARQENGA